jgi:hypothetical protein
MCDDKTILPEKADSTSHFTNEIHLGDFKILDHRIKRERMARQIRSHNRSLTQIARYKVMYNLLCILFVTVMLHLYFALIQENRGTRGTYRLNLVPLICSLILKM